MFDFVGDIAGAVIQGKATNKATKAGKDAAANSLAYQQQTRDLGLAINAPQRQAGYTALAGLMDMAGLSRGSLQPGQTVGMNYAPRPEQWSKGWNTGYTGRFRDFTDKGWQDFQNLRNTDPAAFAAESAKMGKTVGGAIFGGKGKGNNRFDFSSFLSEQAKAPGNDVPNLAGMPKYDFKTDPGYQFRLQQGQDQLEASAFARGGGMSGGLAKASMDWGQNLASAEYGNVFNRLATIAGYGQTANNASTAIVGNTGSGMSDAAGSAGRYRASGNAMQANAWGSAIQDMSNGFSNYFGNQQGPPQNSGSVGGGGYRYGP
jgi:hypothetical protein